MTDCDCFAKPPNRLRFQNLGKPRTAGLCGRAAGACDCGLLSCAFIERVNRGRKPPKQGTAGRGTRIPKGSVPHRRSGIHRAFSHIAHKRRNVRFKGLRRVHTPPQPLTAHTAAHTPKHGGNEEPPCAAHLKAQKLREIFPDSMGQKIAEAMTAAKLRLPAKGGLTQFGGAAGPQARVARTLLFPQL